MVYIIEKWWVVVGAPYRWRGQWNEERVLARQWDFFLNWQLEFYYPIEYWPLKNLPSQASSRPITFLRLENLPTPIFSHLSYLSDKRSSLLLLRSAGKRDKSHSHMWSMGVQINSLSCSVINGHQLKNCCPKWLRKNLFLQYL